MDLTDEQWSVVSSIMPELPKRREKRSENSGYRPLWVRDRGRPALDEGKMPSILGRLRAGVV